MRFNLKKPFITTDRIKSAKFGIIHTSFTLTGIIVLSNYFPEYITNNLYWLFPLVASIMPINHLADYILYKRMLKNGVTKLE